MARLIKELFDKDVFMDMYVDTNGYRVRIERLENLRKETPVTEIKEKSDAEEEVLNREEELKMESYVEFINALEQSVTDEFDPGDDYLELNFEKELSEEEKKEAIKELDKKQKKEGLTAEDRQEIQDELKAIMGN